MNQTIKNLRKEDKVRLDYVGKSFQRGCLVNVTLDDKGLFNMVIIKKGQYPTFKDVAEARYKYLPDDCYMIQVFPPILEFNKQQKFSITLWELKDDRNDSNKNKRTDSKGTNV